MDDASRRLSPSELLQLHLRQTNENRRFAADEVLFREGEPCDGLYLLLSGKLKVYSAGTGGRELVYEVVGPGALLGELSLDGGPRSASVKALTEATCLVVKPSVVRELIRRHPELADLMIAFLIARARHSTRLTRSIALEGVPERVVALLESLAYPVDGIRRIPSELTQQEIADRIGASREMVHKVIGQLMRNGYLHRDEKRRMSIVKALPGR